MEYFYESYIYFIMSTSLIMINHFSFDSYYVPIQNYYGSSKNEEKLDQRQELTSWLGRVFSPVRLFYVHKDLIFILIRLYS